jgi:putative intracellular protease/amidase/YHS domain-containing protein
MRLRRGFAPTQVLVAIAFTGVLIAIPLPAVPQPRELAEQDERHTAPGSPTDKSKPLPVPPEGGLPVAIVLGKDAEVLDFCGPLEVFANAVTKDGKQLFTPYMVAATMDPVTVGGGMKVLPDHTFKTAPAPKVIVIPAMNTAGAAPEMYDWIRAASKSTDVTMFVCNGAFVLAKTGLLSGKRATAHHGAYFRFAGMFPDVRLRRGARFVDDGNIASAGGVSSGIDLALHVVERYVGRELAMQVADGIEYQGKGWLNPDANEAYATMPAFDEGHPVCPLCRMDVDRSIKTSYKGKDYYFCAFGEKEFFETHLDVFERFLAEDAALRAGSKRWRRDPTTSGRH